MGADTDVAERARYPVSRTATAPRQVWECPRCGTRYASPLANLTQVGCHHRSHSSRAVAMRLIWDRKTHGGSPPPLTKGAT